MTRQIEAPRAREPIELRFSSPGSLARPGPVGRTIRLLMGGWLLYALVQLLDAAPRFATAEAVPRDTGFWLYVLIAFHVTPYVVNIGFGRDWRHGSQLLLAAGTLALVAVDWLAYGRLWGPPLGIFTLAWMLYFSAHLGGSFVLSAILGTPGCEMRALPHLWARVRGREAAEHYCPGPLDGIDRWEAARRPRRGEDSGREG